MNESNLARIPHECAIQLHAVYDTLKTAERRAADFLLDRPGDIPGLGIVEFANRAGCSEATVVRLAKKLGYEGYPTLKRAFGGWPEGNGPVEYENIRLNDEPLAVMHKVIEASVAALLDTRNVIDREAYEGSLVAMLSASRIMFCGVGDAGVVAEEAYQRWARMGHLSLYSSDFDMQLILASKLQKGDVLLAVSHSGRTRSTLNVVRAAKRQRATVIALTNFPISPLAKRADFTLQTAVFSRFATGEVMSKRLAELCIIESLSINFLIRKGAKYVRSLADSNEVVSINKV
jgi:DNA-binding MurR/RpiR family transcriptional regulator